jgi:hypothetical protein
MLSNALDPVLSAIAWLQQLRSTVMAREGLRVFTALNNRLFFWKEEGTRRENLPADQLRHIIPGSDHISAVVDSTQGLLKPEDMERLKALTRTLEEINRRVKSG